MIERPIIFSGPMVRAILEGRKTQDLRIIKPQPDLCGDGSIYFPDRSASRWKHYVSEGHFIRGVAVDFSPYGQPGDRLWVKETWCSPMNAFGRELMDYEPFYQATDDHLPLLHKWSRSIFMPRWASRITLEITNVRVERVQEISEDDAKAEGAERMHLDDLGQSFKSYKRGFQSIWESLHGPGSWDANPLVWVIEFKRVEASP
ncbi:MAG: hypothetical protein ABIJ57_01385 [Pseudomonadota bacterium]